MGYCVSNIIAIRTGGVFSDSTDIEKLKQVVVKVAKCHEDLPELLQDIKTLPISVELTATKGSYAVIAGVFNYTGFNTFAPFVQDLSKVLDTYIVYTCWNEQTNNLKSLVFSHGEVYNGTGDAITEIRSLIDRTI